MSFGRSPAPAGAPPEMEPAAALRYERQNRLCFLFDQLSADSQGRVLEFLETLTKPDAHRIAAFAQALVAWPDPDASSG